MTKFSRNEAQRRQNEIIIKSKAMWEDLKLKKLSYYVAEISWSPTNPPHRVIIATFFNDTDKVEIYSRSYENVDTTWIGALHSFKIIAAIPKMNG